MIWFLAFIYYDFDWIWLDFGLISAGFRVDFGLDFALSIAFPRFLHYSRFFDFGLIWLDLACAFHLLQL